MAQGLDFLNCKVMAVVPSSADCGGGGGGRNARNPGKVHCSYLTFTDTREV